MTSNWLGGEFGTEKATLNVIFAVTESPDLSGFERTTAWRQLGWMRAMVPPMHSGVRPFFCREAGGGAAGKTRGS